MKNFLLIGLIFILSLACTSARTPGRLSTFKAPEEFKARFETTYGNIEIRAVREWSPLGVDRLYHLIRSGFFTNIAIYRVVPNYVAQFGISDDRKLNEEWEAIPINDEPVIKSNLEGTIAFARMGPNSRNHQIYINLKDNSHLDTINYNDLKGFPVVAEVIDGMELVKQFFDEYGNKPIENADSIFTYGNAYLRKVYPELDYIERAYILSR